MKEVNSIEVRDATFDCPYCGELQDGFLNDPRGGKFKCEECNKEYLVSESSVVIIN